ncbi:MAG: RluA family pseudouridine synthase [Candidatus Dadabacteria bacterium]|nr:MAG: RluA family pseudouridine synthase [Candidatus Dadabacteria bacterium]
MVREPEQPRNRGTSGRPRVLPSRLDGYTDVQAMQPEPAILYSDNHLLVVDKPHRWLVQGDRTGDPSLLDWGREWIRRTANKPGNVYLGLVHRLDRPAAGVVVFARTSKAAARLSAAFRDRNVFKQYRVLVEQPPPTAEGRLEHWIQPARGVKNSRVFEHPADRAQHAALTFRTVGRFGPYTELDIELETGRKHQIRAQLAHIGSPIVGDRRYGASQPYAHGAIALRAQRLTLPHPTRKEQVSWESQLQWATPAKQDW